MPVETATLSLENPVFHTYVLAAGIMLLKLMLQPWMTVVRMMKVRGGFRSPEDAKKSPLNPNPEPAQLEVNEYVERSRRINLNDLESIPGFLAAGLLLVLADPPLLLAQVLIWGYVAARAAHFVAYITAQLHDIRATCWTFSSLAVIAMVIYVLTTASAQAHHSIVANFDPNREIEIRGQVVEFRLRSPHSFLVVDGIAFLDGMQQGTAAERWEIEGDSLAGMRTYGIDAGTFAPGDRITVRGAPARALGLRRANANIFFAADGTEYSFRKSTRLFDPTLRQLVENDADVTVIETAAAGVHRLVGRWQPPFQPNGPASALPLNENGLKAWREYDQTQSPANTCERMSVPDIFNAPFYLVDIRINESRAVVQNEAYEIVRTIPLDGTGAPADPDGQLGVVSGWIEGETLVIESRGYPPSKWGLGAATQILGGGADVPSSEQKTVSERYSVSEDGQRLIYEYTLSDPVYLTRPYEGRVEFTRVPADTPIYSYDCDVASASQFSRE